MDDARDLRPRKRGSIEEEVCLPWPAVERVMAGPVGWALLAVAVGWALFVHLDFPVLPYDDAFIIYRYADNLVSGLGLVYNAGERIFGVSTPLFVWWVATLKFLLSAVPTPDLVVRANAIWFLGAALALFALARALGASRGISTLLVLLFLANPQLLAISVGGMESMLFVGLVMGALAALISRRVALGAAAAGLALATRPEALVLLPLVLLSAERPRRAWLPLMLTLAPMTIWTATSWAYYGSPLPHSVIAKMQPLYPLAPGAALSRIIDWTVTWSLVGSLKSLAQLRSVLVVNLVVVGLVSGAVVPPHGRRGGWMLSALVAALVLLYHLGNPLFFEWYWPALFVPGLTAVLVGMGAFWHHLRRARKLGGPAQVATRVLEAALPLWLLGATVGHYLVGPEVMAEPISIMHLEDDPTRLRTDAYRQAAESLNRLAEAHESLAAPEVGALGYYYRGRVLDACGLVSPEALPFLPVPAEQRVQAMFGAISEGFVKATSPRWVVTMPVFAARSLFVSEWFKNQYTPVLEIPLARRCWGSRSVLVFGRNPGPE